MSPAKDGTSESRLAGGYMPRGRGMLSLALPLVIALLAVTACTSRSPDSSVAPRATPQTRASKAATSGAESSAIPSPPATSEPSESSPAAPPTSTAPKPVSPSPELHYPGFGSAERKAILDGLRPAIERDLGQRVIFEVERLAVKDGYAFGDVIPRKPSGTKIDYMNTRYRRLVQDGVFDGGNDAHAFALLRYRDGAWEMLTFVLGPTDVAYATWWKDYQAPKAIFPYTE